VDELQRERALFLYRNALERGDSETVDRVLHLAEADGALENMILESHALDVVEADALVADAPVADALVANAPGEDASAEKTPGVWDTETIRQSLALHLGNEEAEPVGQAEVHGANAAVLPLTFADVAARMQADSGQMPPLPASHSQAGEQNAEFAHLTQHLRQLAVPLPNHINEHSLSQFFHRQGIVASSQFQQGFLETALFLNRHREQHTKERPAN
jgi:hypothetical protein